MKAWTIRRRILASFGGVLTLTVGVGLLAMLQFNGIREATEHLERDAMPGVEHSAELQHTVLELQLLTERHVASSDRKKLQALAAELQAQRAVLETRFRKYEGTIFTQQDRERFQAVTAAREPYLETLAQVLELSDQLKNDAAAALVTRELLPEFDRLQAAIDALVALNRSSGADAIRSIEERVARSAMALLSGFALAALLTFLFGQALFHAINRPLGRLMAALDVMRQGNFTGRLTLERADEFGAVSDGFNRMSDELAALVGQIQKSGLQVTTSVTEVSATSKQQQATAKEIAATTAEIGATSREIAATSQELARTMAEVSGVAERTAGLAASGQAGLNQMEDTMSRVMDAAGTISAKLAVLTEKAGNITQVITTITKVADQTNLLSLNAAIEAEKAGEHGRGFAVVATEVRRLADQTSVATFDIDQIVKEIQSAVSASVMGMDKFSEEVRRGLQNVQQTAAQLSEIIEQVQALVPRFETVNEGMRMQATSAGQITEALAQLNDAAQQTAESLRESSQAIDELNQVASVLRGGVSRFKLAAA